MLIINYKMLNKLSHRSFRLNSFHMDAQVFVVHHIVVSIGEVARIYSSRVVQDFHYIHPQIATAARMPVKNFQWLKIWSDCFNEISWIKAVLHKRIRFFKLLTEYLLGTTEVDEFEMLDMRDSNEIDHCCTTKIF